MSQTPPANVKPLFPWKTLGKSYFFGFIVLVLIQIANFLYFAGELGPGSIEVLLIFAVNMTIFFNVLLFSAFALTYSIRYLHYLAK